MTSAVEAMNGGSRLLVLQRKPEDCNEDHERRSDDIEWRFNKG